MTPEETIEMLRGMQNKKVDYAEMVCAPAFASGYKYVYPEPEDYAIEEAISALKEIQQYREIGTVEQVKNQKENLNVAYQIISDYEQYGTVEEFKMAQRYMRLVNAHGTIGQMIDSCAEYEEIGTVEECREAREKQIPKKPVCKPKPYNESVGFNEEWFCPSCGAYIGYFYEGMDEPEQMEYCNECGQHIARDWSDENEDE